MGRHYRNVDNGWATVIALDPGGTTGWAVLCVEKDALSDPDLSILKSITHYAQGQVEGSENTQILACCELLAAWPYAAVVIEDFILRKFQQGREMLSPVRITAAIDYLFWRGLDDIDPPGRLVFKQQPSLAMRTATDDRLKTWGLYRPGQEHARDATRHAITFLRRGSEKPRLRAMAWPHTYDSDGELLSTDTDSDDGETPQQPRRSGEQRRNAFVRVGVGPGL